MEAKLNALMNKMENQDKRMHSAHELGTVDDSERGNSVEKGLTHEGPYQVEEPQYLNGNISYNFKTNLNFPSHYTPTLRNHENFSYGGGAQQGQRPRKNFQQHHVSPRFQQQKTAVGKLESRKLGTEEIFFF